MRDITNRYASFGDNFLFWFGNITAGLFGAALPGFCLIFGELIDELGDTTGFESMKDQALIMIYLGLGVWLVSWAQITCLLLFAERVSFKIKCKYFESCLEKDAAFYDE